MNPTGTQIVAYQPSDVTRIVVRFDGKTTWLALPQIVEFFSCSTRNVRLHPKNNYVSGKLDKEATSKKSSEVRKEGSRNVTRRFVHCNLDAIISVVYKMKSLSGSPFRRWETQLQRVHSRPIHRHRQPGTLPRRRSAEGSCQEAYCLHETRCERNSQHQKRGVRDARENECMKIGLTLYR